jgi:hypothetical protein
MTVDDQPTCGKGLAAGAALPESLGTVMDAMAEVLEAHLQALDLDDESSRLEYAAYESLAREHREIAAQLAATAQEMLGYRDLPMGRHDMEAMSRQHDPFKNLVDEKRKLLVLLQESVKEDQALLEEMGCS